MRKILAVFLIIFSLFKAHDVSASVRAVSSSAQIKYESRPSQTVDLREIQLARFLEKHNSPLAPYSGDFIRYADEYDLDYRLVPAIAGVESTFGKRIPKGFFNAYGWANGNYRFKSWEDSIQHVSKTLRDKYYDRGATNIGKIARRYAPPSKTWGWKVKYFMNEIDSVPVNFDL